MTSCRRKSGITVDHWWFSGVVMRSGTTGVMKEQAVWLTPHEAATYLRVGVDTIYDACADGRLKHTKLGYRTIRLKRAWIDEWAEGHKPAGR